MNLMQTPKRRHNIFTRNAFTMVEIVFVIVITGLVAVAGSKAIVQILQNYTLQKMYAKTEMDSASAIRQISNYLQNAIWDSIALKPSNNNNYAPIGEVSTHTDGKLNNIYKDLYFIEKDMDNISGYYDNGNNVPYFNGFVNLKLSGIQDANGIGVNRIITEDKSQLHSYKKNGHAIYFPFVNIGSTTSVYDKYFTQESQRKALFKIQLAWQQNNGTGLITFLNSPKQIGDIAVLVNGNPSYITLYDKAQGNFEKGDLVLSRMPLGTTNRADTIIAKKVSNIHFWTESSSSLIRIRICFEAGVVKSIMEEFCKEGIIMQ